MKKTAISTWKVGPLAARLGTTVRTLHHYEEFGLVTPERDPQSGHRIYGQETVLKLQKVQLLRTLGLSLADIRDLLTPSEVSLAEVLRLHRNRLKRQMSEMRNLVQKVDGLEAYVSSGGAETTEELFSLLETIMDFEKYYTEEQLAELAKRREALGEEGMQKAQQDWQDLIAEVRQAAEDGTSPESPLGQELARRWEALIEGFTGGNPGIRESLANAYRDQPGSMEQMGIDSAMQEWVAQASRKPEG